MPDKPETSMSVTLTEAPCNLVLRVGPEELGWRLIPSSWVREMMNGLDFNRIYDR